ncbi:MAG: DUF5333 domain-containing protein [Rhodobacteraceae bacterium]|nr:DUF5333 domain-containing protein [Paracoccaceae bacterium]
MRTITGTALVVTLLTTTALANPPLREVKHINDGLLVVGLANEIRKNCNSISGRLIKGYTYLKSLERQARSMGYTQAEIDTFVDDRTEKNRLKAKGEKYLVANGVKRSEPQTFCVLGNKEIAEASAIGSLLKN